TATRSGVRAELNWPKKGTDGPRISEDVQTGTAGCRVGAGTAASVGCHVVAAGTRGSRTGADGFGDLAQAGLTEFLSRAIQHAQWQSAGDADDRSKLPSSDQAVHPSGVGVERQLPDAERSKYELAIKHGCTVVEVWTIAIAKRPVGILI